MYYINTLLFTIECYHNTLIIIKYNVNTLFTSKD